MLKLIMILAVLLAVQADQHRELRRGGGGGRSSSRSSSRSSYYSGGYSKPTKTTMTKTTYRATTNKYMSNGRTTHVLYVYYLPPNYYNAIGFYSPVYL